MACDVCKREISTVARGLCNACYQRWRKTGTTEYQRKGKTTPCQIDGCRKRAVSHGLCDKHRQRLRKHGHVEETRPDSWGAKHGHPLFHSWAWMRRHRGRHEVAPEWRDDFLQFIADVGGRPSPKHKLYPANDSKPIGPGNFVWKQSLTERAEGEDEKTYQARAQKLYRSVRREEYAGYDRKRHYGMSRGEYDALHKRQDGKCAICRQPETQKIRGKTLSLAVDHCHTKGAVRGLLCSDCNRGLGFFKDDPEALQRAADYLRWPERII